jgi:phosphoketolase
MPPPQLPRGDPRAWALPTVPSDENLSRDGRVMELLSEHCCQGWLEGYVLSGCHGLFACETGWRAPVASLNYLITSYVWEQDHNGYGYQGPNFINLMLTKKAAISRVYLPPDASCFLSVTDHCLRSRNYINLIVASKKPMPHWLDIEAARRHCADGAAVWDWASNDEGRPDVIGDAVHGNVWPRDPGRLRLSRVSERDPRACPPPPESAAISRARVRRRGYDDHARRGYARGSRVALDGTVGDHHGNASGRGG